jgi:glycosyltransferase involved in cell wall biosynthesis
MKIAVYVPGTAWGSVNPDTLNAKGLGGRETVAVNLALLWAEEGHEVTVFAHTTSPRHHFTKAGGVASFIEQDMALPMLANFTWDVLVAMDDPTLIGHPVVQMNAALTYCHMHCAHLPTYDEGIIAAPDVYVAVSPWHADFLSMQSENIRAIEVMRNCIFPEKYGTKECAPFGEPNFLYASSPDRGLVHLLRNWPKFREAFPGCVLSVAYGVEDYVERAAWAHSQSGEEAVDIAHLINQEGIDYYGRIHPDRLALLHDQSDFLLYPCDPSSPTETGCITILEALASGNVVVTTDADCLPSEFSEVAVICSLPFDIDQYIKAVDVLWKNEEAYIAMQKAGHDFAEARDWRSMANAWLEMFDRHTQELMEALNAAA